MTTETATTGRTSTMNDPWTGEPMPELDQPVEDDGHVCADEVIEEATSPAPNGTFTVTERCGRCGKVVGQHDDSVL